MKKILIFGNSGAGKSTLAKSLCEEYSLAHLDLDTLAWKPVTPPERETIETSAQAIQHFVDKNPSWVIEGCYTDLMTLVAPHANEVIYMNLPIELCVDNARSRPWEPHKYESKEAQDKNLDMLINWIKAYDTRDDGIFSRTAHQQFFESFTGNKRMVTENQKL